MGLIGVLVVLGVWRGLGGSPWWTIAALLASVTLYGLAFPYTRRCPLPRDLPPLTLERAQLLLASATLLPTFLMDGSNGYAVSVKALAGVLALGVFGSGLAFMWDFRIIGGAGSSVASTVTFLTPVVALVVSIVFLHEALAWFEPAGEVLVLLGAPIGQDRFARR